MIIELLGALSGALLFSSAVNKTAERRLEAHESSRKREETLTFPQISRDTTWPLREAPEPIETTIPKNLPPNSHISRHQAHQTS